jgi:hypothetical protein
MPVTSEYLPTYLNDHLAGSVMGLGLARRAVEHNRDSAYARDLRVIAEEIAEDKRTLEELMRDLTVRRNPVKRLGAWVGERARRLKPNRRLVRYSPLSRLEEIEMLTLGVTGKLSLWRALRHSVAAERGLSAWKLDDLIARAESQQQRLEALRLRAAGDALQN